MVVMKYLKDYVEDGRYTIIVGLRMKSLMIKIKELYPTAVVTTSDADEIRGKKLLVDKWAADGLGLKATLPKYRTQDVVYENFTKQFVEGGNVTVNFSSKGYEEWEHTFNQIFNANEELQKKFYHVMDDIVLNGTSKQQPVGILNEPRHKSSAWIQDTIGK